MSSTIKACENKKDPYAFISYSHKDEHVVTYILRKLQENGYNVWFDRHIKTGAKWSDYIAKWLKHDNCKWFIVFLSQDSVMSDPVKDEINLAKKYHKNIIVVYLEDNVVLPDGLELELDRIQSINWFSMSEADFISSLIDGMNAIPSPEPKIKIRKKDVFLMGCFLLYSVLISIMLVYFFRLSLLANDRKSNLISDTSEYLNRFCIEDDTYEVGCRLEDFLNNGWKLNTEDSSYKTGNKNIMNPYSSEEIFIIRNESSIKLKITNNTKDKISYDTCYISSIEISTWQYSVSSIQVAGTDLISHTEKTTVETFLNESQIKNIVRENDESVMYTEAHHSDVFPTVNLYIDSFDDKISYVKLSFAINDEINGEPITNIGALIQSIAIDGEKYDAESTIGDYLNNGWVLVCADLSGLEPEYITIDGEKSMQDGWFPIRLHKDDKVLYIPSLTANQSNTDCLKDVHLSYVGVNQRSRIEQFLVNSINLWHVTRDTLQLDKRSILENQKTDTSIRYILNDTQEIDFSFKENEILPYEIKLQMRHGKQDKYDE